jgi:hypothetical protein
MSHQMVMSVTEDFEQKHRNTSHEYIENIKKLKDFFPTLDEFDLNKALEKNFNNIEQAYHYLSKGFYYLF